MARRARLGVTAAAFRAQSPRACARRRQAASSVSLRRSRGSAPSWANAAATAPDVAADTMRSPPEPSLGFEHRIGARRLRLDSSGGVRRRCDWRIGRTRWCGCISGPRRYPAHGAILVDHLGQFENVAPLRWGGSHARAVAPTRRSAPGLSSAMIRLMEAMISSIEGSDGNFPAGMEAPDKFRLTWARLSGIASTTASRRLTRKGRRGSRSTYPSLACSAAPYRRASPAI